MKDTTTAVGVTFSVLMLVLLAATAVEAAKPPAGRTYFVISMGVATDASEAYEVSFGCLTFTSTEMCDEASCGTWRRIDSSDKAKRQESVEFELSVVDDETGEPVDLVGRADLDSRGRKSSFGGAVTGVEPRTGRRLNLALGARAVGAARCPRLVAAAEGD